MRAFVGAVTIAAMTRGEATKSRHGTKDVNSPTAPASRRATAEALSGVPSEAGMIGQEQRIPRSVAHELV